MPDPFRVSSRDQIYREAQIGLALVACLSIVFVYVTVKRMSSSNGGITVSGENAAVSRTYVVADPSALLPDSPPEELRQARTRRPETLSSSGASDEADQAQDNGPSDIDSTGSQDALAGGSANWLPLPDRLKQSLSGNSRLPVSKQIAATETESPKKPSPFKPASTEKVASTDSGNSTSGSFQPTMVAPTVRQNSTDVQQQLKVQPKNTDVVPAGLPDDGQPVPHMTSPRPVLPGGDRQNPGLSATHPPVNDLRHALGGSWSNTPVANPLHTTPTPPYQAPRPDSEELRLPPRVKLVPNPTSATAQDPSRYAVGSGESYYSIAQKRYGDGRYFRALCRFNEDRGIAYEQFEDGVEVLVPEVEQLEREYAEICPAPPADQPVVDQDESSGKSIHVTREGETLFDIARQRLGQASRFPELAELNAEQLGPKTHHLTRLPAGLKLKLPAK